MAASSRAKPKWHQRSGRCVIDLLSISMIVSTSPRYVARLWPVFGVLPVANSSKFSNPSTPPLKAIKMEDGAALAYYGMFLSGVKVQPAPFWMQVRLQAIGQRPINNIVDASNYTMFECGQPNHAFDARNLQTNSIGVVLNGNKFHLEKFTTLDGELRKLPLDTIIITDGLNKKARPVALAGIMGGLDSEVKEDTHQLFLESATFPRERIRRSLSKMNLRTDSAQRFEKGQDPDKAKPALLRLAELIALTLPEQVLKRGNISGEQPHKASRNKINLSLEFLQNRLGYQISAKDVCNILESLQFKVKLNKKTTSKKKSRTAAIKHSPDPVEFSIIAPTFRSQYDVSIPEDIVEELGRIHGYDNIDPVAPAVAVLPTPPNRERNLQNHIKDGLALRGWNETYNYSFASQSDNFAFNEHNWTAVEVANPVFGDLPFLRLSQLPGLLRQTLSNQDRFENIKLFEFARVYFKTDARRNTGDRFKPGDLSLEEKHISMVHMPALDPNLTTLTDRNIFGALLELRGHLFSILDPYVAGLELRTDDQAALKFLHPGAAAQIYSSDHPEQILGFIGILHPSLEAQFKLKRPVAIANLNYDYLYTLFEKNRLNSNYQAPSVHPESHLELSVLMPETTGTQKPLEIIQALKIIEIVKINLLTIYTGEPLPAGQISVSFRLSLLAMTSSVSSARSQEILEECIVALKNSGFTLR